MDRKHMRVLKGAAGLAAIVAVGFLVDPSALFAAPFILGTVAGDGGDDDPEPEDDPADDNPEDDPDDEPDDDPDGDDPDGDEDPDDEDPDQRADARPGKGKGRNNGMVPAYRLTRLRQQFEERLRQATAGDGKTRQILERLQQVFGGSPDGGSGPTLTPQQQKLRGQFLELFPEFKDVLPLASRSKDLLGLADRAPEWDRDTDQYWQRVATTTSNRLYTAAASELGVKKLDNETRAVLRDAFISWVKADRTQERNHRYEGQDESLIGDFLKFYTGRFRGAGGHQRQQHAAALRRTVSPTRVPRGGNSSTQVPSTQQRRRQRADEDPFDAVNDRAWNQLQDQFAAER
jgi:hypothetical protein